MTQIKAFQILSSLNKEEYDEFYKFILSPYFNRSKDLLKLFDAVKKYHPGFDNPKLDYHKIYTKLYPGKKYTEGTIRNLFTELGNLAEKFLGYTAYENSRSYKFNVLRELSARDLQKYFLKYFTKARREEALTDLSIKNLYIYLYENEIENYEIVHNDDISARHHQSSSEALLTFFLETFFGRQSSLIARQFNYNLPAENNIVNLFFEKTDVNALLNMLEANNSEDWRKLKLYYHLNLAFQNKNNNFEEDLFKAREIFQSDKINMPDDLKFDIYVRLSNIINTNAGPDDFHLKKLLFEIKKEMVEKGITSELYGQMRVMEYITTADAALNVNEVEWANSFIESKKNSIEENLREDLYNFYKSRILFYQNKYTESNEYLSKVNQESVMLKIDIKVQRMKNFYELNYIEPAFSQVEAFRNFLKRSELMSEARMKSFSNFLKFYYELLKKKSGKKIDISLLKDEILNCRRVRKKPWLLAKVNEFEKQM